MISCGEIVSQSDDDKKIGALLECISPERCDREGWCFRWQPPWINRAAPDDTPLGSAEQVRFPNE